MTHLRKLMLEELERRNYSQNTVRTYLMTIEDFARYFHKPPDTLGPEHVREYQAYLFRERKLAANTVNQRVGALRFFFIKTLKKNWSVEETPYPKRVIRLPKTLSPEEVGRLIICFSWTGLRSSVPIGNSMKREKSFRTRVIEGQSHQRFASSEGTQDSTRPLVAIGGIVREETPE